MSSNCSFRITRTTEDLAQTITALSQRLIKLEQRFEAIDLQLKQQQSDLPVNEIEMLDGIDQQLKVCKALLEESPNQDPINETELVDQSSEADDLKDEDLVLDQSSEAEESEQMWIEEKEDTIAA